jgi:hypothetical protein
MGIVVWVSAGAFFFFFSFCAAAGDVIDKKIAVQMASIKSARKLRAGAGTGFAAIGVLSLTIQKYSQKNSTRAEARVFNVRVSYCAEEPRKRSASGKSQTPFRFR